MTMKRKKEGAVRPLHLTTHYEQLIPDMPVWELIQAVAHLIGDWSTISDDRNRTVSKNPSADIVIVQSLYFPNARQLVRQMAREDRLAIWGCPRISETHSDETFNLYSLRLYPIPAKFWVRNILSAKAVTQMPEPLTDFTIPIVRQTLKSLNERNRERYEPQGQIQQVLAAQNKLRKREQEQPMVYADLHINRKQALALFWPKGLKR